MQNFGHLIERKGLYSGEGINHEGQKFRGTLSLEPIIGGKGIELRFKAQGEKGEAYHEEQSLIAPTFSRGISLFVISNNHPALAEHTLNREEPLKSGDGKRLIFGLGDPKDAKTFREEIAVDLFTNGDLAYTYCWGMPGGEFTERSGVRMKRI